MFEYGGQACAFAVAVVGRHHCVAGFDHAHDFGIDVGRGPWRAAEVHVRPGAFDGLRGSDFINGAGVAAQHFRLFDMACDPLVHVAVFDGRHSLGCGADGQCGCRQCCCENFSCSHI